MEDPQVVAVLLDSALDLVDEITQVHADDQRRHGQEDVAPQQHVDVVKQLDHECAELKHQLRVVRQSAALLPHSPTTAADVVHMQGVAQQRV